MTGPLSASRPCEKLRILRMRAGMTPADMGRALGYASPSSYPRYENPDKMREKKLPYALVKQLLPILVGKGHPTITHDELIALSDTPQAFSLSTAPASPPTVEEKNSGNITFSAITVSTAEIKTFLPVRVRAERGTFVESAIEGRDLGESPLTAETDHVVTAQFSVLVGDEHAEGFGFPRGTFLRCAFPDQYPNPARLEGKKVVIWIERGNMGLGEMLVTRFREGGAAAWTCEAADGSLLKGRPSGVVVSSLRRE